ncbi:PREDICTED: uncharacterized protein LOC104819790 [Tarenaya hassleriana]|uniref:uncharacterized protein LOC104819790 n=1 Tax=Tarenaya hassleriana TaxID=28532 RepID=UPI00053C3210|nr:PREDICTED: uncharacterized protein LOC104819790 [Tarenaya hassleriana]
MFYAWRSLFRSRHRSQPAICSEAVPVGFRTRRFVSSRSNCAGLMDEANRPVDKNIDVIRSSFGETYASRCEEEGYGGIYGQNQSLLLEKEEIVVQHHPSDDASKTGTRAGGEEAKAEQKTEQPNT